MKQFVSLAVAICLVGAWLFWALGFHFVRKPTADQLFGCDWAHTDIPSGECK